MSTLLLGEQWRTHKNASSYKYSYVEHMTLKTPCSTTDAGEPLCACLQLLSFSDTSITYCLSCLL